MSSAQAGALAASAPASARPAAVGLPRERIKSLACVAIVGVCLVWVYITWLAPTYFYMGFTLAPQIPPSFVLACVLVTVCAAALPVELVRFSDYLLWMVFYFVFLPAMLMVPLQGLLPHGGAALICALAVSYLCMIGLGRRRAQVRHLRLDRAVFVLAFFGVYLALVIYTYIVYRGNLNVVTFANVYEQRALSADVAAAGSLVVYATGFLAGGFNPFLMAVGLVEKRRLWLLMGTLGQVFVYSTSGLKSVLLSIVLAPVFYWFVFKRSRITSARLGALVVASVLLPLCLLPVLNDTGEGLEFLLVSLIFMRTYGTAGTLTGVYADFFANHPHTYFSHIGGVNGILPYPYGQTLGEEVGYYLTGGLLDANANFWATDGIASAGNLGVIVVGLIIGGFLVLANGILSEHNRRVAFVAFVPFIVAISNTSFFTSMLGGGGAVVLVLLYFWQSMPRPASRSR
jgi:hypothetical protein